MTNVTSPASSQPDTIFHWIAQVIAHAIVSGVGQAVGCAIGEVLAEAFAIARNRFFANRHPNLL